MNLCARLLPGDWRAGWVYHAACYRIGYFLPSPAARRSGELCVLCKSNQLSFRRTAQIRGGHYQLLANILKVLGIHAFSPEA